MYEIIFNRNTGCDSNNRRDLACPDGSYITKITGNVGDGIDSIGIVCSNGETKSAGGPHGTRMNDIECSNGFNALHGQVGNRLDNVAVTCSSDGIRYGMKGYFSGGFGDTCPAGEYLTNLIPQVGKACGADTTRVTQLSGKCNTKGIDRCTDQLMIGNDYECNNYESVMSDSEKNYIINNYCVIQNPRAFETNYCKDRVNLANICNNSNAITTSSLCREYCSNNIEACTSGITAYCSAGNNMNMSFCKDTLKKIDAAGKFDPIVDNFCNDKPNDPFCACVNPTKFNQQRADIAAEITDPRGRNEYINRSKIYCTYPPCYGGEAYKDSNKDMPCENITVCTSSISTERVTALQGSNINFIAECNINEEGNNNTNTNTEEKSSKKYIYIGGGVCISLLLLIAVIAIVFIL